MSEHSIMSTGAAGVSAEWFDDVSEARERVASLRVEQEAARRGAILSEPACPRGCALCFRACAVAGIKLDWWRGELARLTGVCGTVH